MVTVTQKRIQAYDDTIAAGNSSTFTLQQAYPTDCNCHGVMVDIWVGANAAGQTAFSFGHWVLSVKQRGSTNLPVVTTAGLIAELDNPIIWAVGTWMANQNPVPIIVAPRTSRNIPKGAKLSLTIGSSALSAFTVRVHGTAHWFEKTL